METNKKCCICGEKSDPRVTSASDKPSYCWDCYKKEMQLQENKPKKQLTEKELQDQLVVINKEIAAGGVRKQFAELMIAILNRFASLENRILKIEKWKK